MTNLNKEFDENSKQDYNQGPQGVDKALGEDKATGNEDIMREAQKGKKVDADVTNPDETP